MLDIVWLHFEFDQKMVELWRQAPPWGISKMRQRASVFSRVTWILQLLGKWDGFAGSSDRTKCSPTDAFRCVTHRIQSHSITFMYIQSHNYNQIYNHIYIDNQRCIQPNNIVCALIFEAPSTDTFRFCKERPLLLGASRRRQAERKVDTADACLACSQRYCTLWHRKERYVPKTHWCQLDSNQWLISKS